MEIEQLKRRAEAGSCTAQSILGIYYLYGEAGIGIDYAEAFRLLSSASQSGASRAKLNLARMYLEGLGIQQNVAKAIELYESIAKAEFLAAIALARIYTRGAGVSVDENQARRWYSIAVSFEDRIAGCEQELSEAKSYLAS